MPTADPRPDSDTGLRTTGPAIALIAGSVMVFELSLIRIFSFITWHHFAFMVISVALLGFGLSGVVLELWPASGRPHGRRAALYAALFAFTGLAAVAVTTRLRVDLLQISRDPTQIAGLLASYLVLLLPFTFAGLAVVTLLGSERRRVHLIYGLDLLGAALGCLLMVFWTGQLRVEGMLMVAAALALASSALLAPGRSAEAALAVAALGLVAVVPLAPEWMAVPPGPGKSLAAHLARTASREGEIRSTHWSALFRTDVVENSRSFVPWTRNAAVDLPPPPSTRSSSTATR